MVPNGKAYHTDWVWANNANIHVANHLGWFTSFTIHSFPVETGYGGPILEAQGYGQVKLQARTNAEDSQCRTIMLSPVVFCPEAKCNIIGSPLLKNYNVSMMGSDSKVIDRATDRCAGIFDTTVLFKLLLKG